MFTQDECAARQLVRKAADRGCMAVAADKAPINREEST